MENVDREFGVELTLDHFGRGLLDRLRRFLVEEAQGLIDRRGRPFDQPHGPDHGARESQRTDREVLEGAGSLHPIIGGGWDSQFAHGVAFDSSRQVMTELFPPCVSSSCV